MLAAETRYEHIVLVDDVPVIAGSNTKVVELVLDSKAYGWSPEELHFQHPHLSMGQIYSAVAYYRDHLEEMENEIERRLGIVTRIEKAQIKPTKLESRLKSKGLISACLHCAHALR